MRRWPVLVLTALAVAGLVFLWRGGRSTPETARPRADGFDAEESRGESPGAAAADGPQLGGELPEVLVDPSVVIAKSARTLAVYSDGRLAKTYSIALGSRPEGDKEREGDLKTPEGEFYVCSKNPESRFHRALGLSYPSEEDAERGLADGTITKRQYNDIVKAIHQMRQPPWNTPLGGEIMIHGGGTHRDWTEGCIALSDVDAEELFGALPLGTPMRIAP